MSHKIAARMRMRTISMNYLDSGESYFFFSCIQSRFALRYWTADGIIKALSTFCINGSATILAQQCGWLDAFCALSSTMVQERDPMVLDFPDPFAPKPQGFSSSARQIPTVIHTAICHTEQAEETNVAKTEGQLEATGASPPSFPMPSISQAEPAGDHSAFTFLPPTISAISTLE
jgi:hypothetical protein